MFFKSSPKIFVKSWCRTLLIRHSGTQKNNKSNETLPTNKKNFSWKTARPDSLTEDRTLPSSRPPSSPDRPRIRTLLISSDDQITFHPAFPFRRIFTIQPSDLTQSYRINKVRHQDFTKILGDDLKNIYTVRIADLDNLNLVKIRNGGLVLDSSQLPLLIQMPQEITLASKVVKIDSKIINLLH